MISLNPRTLRAAAIVGVVLLSAGCDKRLEDDKPNFDGNLIHYFPFSGNGVDEVTGQNFDVHGATYLTDRKEQPENSIFFNGVNSWLEINAGLEAEEGTAAFWIFPCLCKENNPLFVKQLAGSDSFFGQYYIGYNEEGQIETSCQGKWNVETDVVIQANKWFHVAVRWSDASGVVDVFVNAKKVLTEKYTVDPSQLPDDAAVSYLGRILHDANSGNGKSVYYKGKLDELRLYNKWLPYDAIKDLYQE